MRKSLSILGWTAVSVLGAGAFAWLALSRGETVSAAWLLIAALCTYAVAYRFYSRIIAAKVFALDARRRGDRGGGRGGLLRGEPAVGATVQVGDSLIADGVQELRRP